MKTGLAIWHYPHRTMIENIVFFREKGFEALSLLGSAFAEAVAEQSVGQALAAVLQQKNIVLTVHFTLPSSHDPATVRTFENHIVNIAAWQDRYGLISVLSFDVPNSIRDNVTPYIDFVLEHVRNTKVALEDFALNDREVQQIQHLKDNKLFGILIDVGHMYLRLRGKCEIKATLFTNEPSECEATDNPGHREFLKAFHHVQFPIFEIHVSNNDGKKDMHFFLEDGACDMEMVASVLRDFGFDGILTIESAPGFKFICQGTEADRRILKTYDYWNVCCAKAAKSMA